MNEQKALPTQEEIYKLVKENNRMLKAMRRDAFVGGILKFIWWVLILFVVPYLVYVFYLEPYLTNIQSAYEQFNETSGAVSGAAGDLEKLKSQFPNWQELLNQFGGGD